MSEQRILSCPVCGSDNIGTFEQMEGLYKVCCENDDCAFVVETCGATIKEALSRWNGTPRLREQLVKKNEALQASRVFVEGMLKPVNAATAHGTYTISSYHPCQALIDKIDAALIDEQRK